jgi:hypothetical protein
MVSAHGASTIAQRHLSKDGGGVLEVETLGVGVVDSRGWGIGCKYYAPHLRGCHGVRTLMRRDALGLFSFCNQLNMLCRKSASAGRMWMWQAKPRWAAFLLRRGFATWGYVSTHRWSRIWPRFERGWASNRVVTYLTRQVHPGSER